MIYSVEKQVLVIETQCWKRNRVRKSCKETPVILHGVVSPDSASDAPGGAPRVSGFRVQGSEFRVQGSGFRFQVSGFRVQGSGFRVQGSGFSGFKVQGLEFRTQGVSLNQDFLGRRGVAAECGIETAEPPWRQPRGKWIGSLVKFHTNATRCGWHRWRID